MYFPQNISLYAACQRGQLDRVEMLLEKGGADKNWHNPYYVSCLQVLNNNNGEYMCVNPGGKIRVTSSSGVFYAYARQLTSRV